MSLGCDDIMKFYAFFDQLINTVHYLQPVKGHKIRSKCIMSKNHEKYTTHRPQVSVVQCNVTKSKSLYTRYLPGL